MKKFLASLFITSLILLPASFAFAANNPPQVVSITPSEGNSQVSRLIEFTATYTDLDGVGNISRAYILVNTSSGLQNGFSAYYDNTTNKLYMLNDQGTAIGGFTPGSFRVINNSYCRLNCSNTRVNKSGNTMSITWAVTFKKAFSGKSYNTYLKTLDKANAQTGWIQKGTWTVNSPPTVVRLTPYFGKSLPDQQVRLISYYKDRDRADNISLANILVNTSANLQNCFAAYYDNGTNKLYMLNDQGAPIGGFSPGSSNIIENSYAKLDCSKTSTSRSFNTLRVNWFVTFKSTFIGAKNSYLSVSDKARASSGWIQLGTWTIQEAQVLSIKVDPHAWDIGAIGVNTSAVISQANKITVTNDGTGTKTVTLAVTNPSAWTAGTTSGNETFVLRGLLCNTTDVPDAADFKDDDIVLPAPKKATSNIFGYSGSTADGSSVLSSGKRSLYLQFLSPTITKEVQSKEITVVVTVQSP